MTPPLGHSLHAEVPHQAASQAFFLPVASGQRFCVYHPPQCDTGAAPRGLVLHVHAFAEEMNKARRMTALQSRALAAAGYAVLLIDLLGCGDSSGDFGDASWDQWVDDIVLASSWLRGRADAPLWLWGTRAGCLLANEAAQRLASPSHLLFWQPLPAGKSMLQQFLRMKAAADMLDSGAKGAVDAMRQELAAGRHVEIAGYRLSPALAQGLERAQLLPHPGAQRLEWLELSTREDASLTPVAQATLTRWQQAGVAARGQVLSGPGFWQSAEIAEAPLLIQASLAAMAEGPTA